MSAFYQILYEESSDFIGLKNVKADLDHEIHERTRKLGKNVGMQGYSYI